MRCREMLTSGLAEAPDWLYLGDDERLYCGAKFSGVPPPIIEDALGRLTVRVCVSTGDESSSSLIADVDAEVASKSVGTSRSGRMCCPLESRRVALSVRKAMSNVV